MIVARLAAVPRIAHSAWLFALIGLLLPASPAAQASAPVVEGRVRDAETREFLAGAIVQLEGTSLSTSTDSAGTYRLIGAPAGRQVIHVRRLGYAAARIPVTVPGEGRLQQDVELARVALRLPSLIVTADPGGRARGELGTASVVDRDAIATQTAASLAGILELVPGTVLSPPGLDGVQQVTLRAAPVSVGSDPRAPGAGDLSALGTLIVLDGSPLSNNANLQSTGPRAELFITTSAGGGIDLRKIPATTVERVEVIRGIPSARYGDLTHGAIIVDTRAGVVAPELLFRFDPRTVEGAIVGGRALGASHTFSGTFDIAHTRLAPGLRDDDAIRYSAQFAHRWAAGLTTDASSDQARWTLDSRFDVSQLRQDNPEQPDVRPGYSTFGSDLGIRAVERLVFAPSPQRRLEITGSLNRTAQTSEITSLLLRGAQPFTDRLTEGRTIGRYVSGEYLSRLRIEGEPWLVYGRVEGRQSHRLLRADHTTRVGAELRREWNAGSGYHFDIATPPQATFTGVQGFDRPRGFDSLPALTTSAFYLDDRFAFSVAGLAAQAQVGARAELLHEGEWWASGVRDAVLQPRLNLQVAPRPWLRLRGGVGYAAKAPTIGQLAPADQYYDVVNVNYFTNDPRERLAVLTTFIRSSENPDLGFAVSRKMEAGIEADVPVLNGHVSIVGYRDRLRDAVGFQSIPGSITRERYQLADSVPGSGSPPRLVDPPVSSEPVPIITDRPDNNLLLTTSGAELTLSIPPIRWLRTGFDIQAAVTDTRLESNQIDFGSSARVSDFQLDPVRARIPYYGSVRRTGLSSIITYRIVHHRPEVGLILTTTIQHYVREKRENRGEADTLAFEGYLTREGQLVAVPRDRRTDAEFADLRLPRGSLRPAEAPDPDWLMSLQVSKTLPLDGRLSFYAFNAFDRVGRYSQIGQNARLFPAARYGVELSLPLGTLVEAVR